MYSTPNTNILLSLPCFVRLMSVIMKNRLVYGRKNKCIGLVCITDKKLFKFT